MSSGRQHLQPTDVWVLPKTKAVLVRLPAWDWTLKQGARLALASGSLRLEARQTGTGNHEGRPAIYLSPVKEWSEAEATLRSMLERKQPFTLYEL